jgi:hypothetical protein
VLEEHHLKFYKTSLNSNNNRAAYKKKFECLGIGLFSVQWFVFFEFLTPFTLRGYNFLISNPFFTIVNLSDAPRRGVQIWL